MLKHLFNYLKGYKRYKKKAALAFIFSALFITLSCGKRKPPLPPVERVVQRAEINGIQQGSTVILSWLMPTRNAPDGSTLNISRVDIYRLAEPLSSSLTLSEEEFSSSSTLISTVPVSDSDFGKKLFFTDNLDFGGQPARLRYGIRFVNATGQKAAFSNFVLIELAAKIADKPAQLSASFSESEISLIWSSPKANVDGSQPPNILGYNVYRTASDDKAARILNATPVRDPRFSDKNFTFNSEYTYFVRTVSLGNNGEPVESLDSNKVTIKPIDTFAPRPPEAITIGAAPNQISIFFAVNLEKDIAGYRVYRSTNPDTPKAEWQLLTSELLKVNTFQDTNVESGKTYFYYLTAVDAAGNVSQPSEVVSETVP